MHSDQLGQPEELRPDELFSRFDRQGGVVAHPKIESLPLHPDLTPRNFERLVARLADPPRGSPVQAVRYGESGSTQGGVDVICIDAAAKRCDCFEGKRVATIARGDITGWVHKFIEGKHKKTARSFTLCTTYPIATATSLLDEWQECCFLLGEHEIRPELWDNQRLHQLLRSRWDIVSELFGETVANGFCTERAPRLETSEPRTFKRMHADVYGRIASIEHLSVACELVLPDDSQLSTGAILSFARADLSGTSIAIAEQELVRWMQWRAHATSDSPRPYAIPLANDPGRYVLVGSSARLILTKEELDNLDWILEEAWREFCQAAHSALSAFRCLRFKRLPSRRDTFELVSVHRALWHAILDFAREFDVADGDGPWHIFDSAPGCLKVFTERDTERLDSGYHVILYAYNDGRMWMPWESDVVVGWSAPDIGGRPPEIGPRKNWDAEYTHDWLLGELIPEVLRWDAERHSDTGPKRRWWQRQVQASGATPPNVSRLASSRAAGVAWRTVPPEDLSAIAGCARMLQSHATARLTEVQIEASLVRAVLLTIDRLLPYAEPLDEHYLRNKLDLADDENLGMGIRRLAEEQKAPRFYSNLDSPLRCLLAVLEAAQSVPSAERSNIAAHLQPVLDRYQEDVLCDLFTRD